MRIPHNGCDVLHRGHHHHHLSPSTGISQNQIWLFHVDCYPLRAITHSILSWCDHLMSYTSLSILLLESSSYSSCIGHPISSIGVYPVQSPPNTSILMSDDPMDDVSLYYPPITGHVPIQTLYHNYLCYIANLSTFWHLSRYSHQMPSSRTVFYHLLT
jgi:hypothetical protein